jgi:hypothetical protein
MTSWWTGPPLNFNPKGDFRVLRELVLLPEQERHPFSLKRIKSEGKQSCFANDKVILATHGRISLDLLPKKGDDIDCHCVHAAGLFDNEHNTPFAAFHGLHKVYLLSKIMALVTKLDCKVSIHDSPNKHITTSELSLKG